MYLYLNNRQDIIKFILIIVVLVINERLFLENLIKFYFMICDEDNFIGRGLYKFVDYCGFFL